MKSRRYTIGRTIRHSLLLAVNHEEQMSHDTELLLIYTARFASILEQVSYAVIWNFLL